MAEEFHNKFENVFFYAPQLSLPLFLQRNHPSHDERNSPVTKKKADWLTSSVADEFNNKI